MNLLVIMSHQLSDTQIEEAKEVLKVHSIKELPSQLQEIWSNVDPEGELPTGILEPIKDWILKESREKDYVLVQGDFGASFYIVDYCFNIKRIPIYATSMRKVEERVEGNITITDRIFKHVNFRKYVRGL
ncbi:MAG: hypothetical protein GX080_01440 [Tissierellia bacterium]|nr:hypothetical protein [Tissierellia bacterium]